MKTDICSNNREKCWVTLLLTLIVAVAAAVASVIYYGFKYPVGSHVAQGTLKASAVLLPTLISTAPLTDKQDANLTIPPRSIPKSPTPIAQLPFEGPFTYGTSFNGHPLLAYRFGTGSSVYAVIGGIHGGYEWNTVVLISETLKHLQEKPNFVSTRVTLYVIPCANPDGYAAGRGIDARVNGNGVDLNRNWDHAWQPIGKYGTQPINAGTSPFSEPETAALRDFILERGVEAAIFYHSAMARVFYGADLEHSASYELAVVVSSATGYPIAAGVPGQITTGDAIDWMSAQGLAGIEVELTDHENIEWERNLRGLEAFLRWAPSTAPAQVVQTTQIGLSVQGRPIEVTRVGNGDQVVLVIIGSIHGDEANTEALVHSLMEHYSGASEMVPPDFTLYFIPTMNPDGLAAGTRHNANLVDLNGNWPTDDWQSDAVCTSGTILGSGGSVPGSEPEVQAIQRWLLDEVRPLAREIWLLSYHSADPPSGSVRPGYTVYGTPRLQASILAKTIATLSGYTYLPTSNNNCRFMGELIHWCDLNAIWAADVRLPNHNPPNTIPSGGSRTTLETHKHVLSMLMTRLEPDDPLPDETDCIFYTVQPGDTLLGIALQFEAETKPALRLAEKISHLNSISNENYIEVGQEVCIPVTKSDQQ